jgi:hypothetical protein
MAPQTRITQPCTVPLRDAAYRAPPAAPYRLLRRCPLTPPHHFFARWPTFTIDSAITLWYTIVQITAPGSSAAGALRFLAIRIEAMVGD